MGGVVNLQEEAGIVLLHIGNPLLGVLKGQLSHVVLQLVSHLTVAVGRSHRLIVTFAGMYGDIAETIVVSLRLLGNEQVA